MRPILLVGHVRSLTKIKYNRDGDLLFSVSKDSKPCVWFSHNGERLGTFNGHNGTVWDLDISYDSKRLLTASADATMRMWDVYTGKELFQWRSAHKQAVRVVAFAHGDRQAMYVTDATMGQKCKIHIVEIAENPEDQDDETLTIITVPGSKVTVAEWGALNRYIYTGHEDGTLSMWDPESGELVKSVKIHDGQITDMQFSKDRSHMITASKDHSAQVVDAKTLKVMKRYETERPVNAAAMSPLRSHIMLGGGQDAMRVTQTDARQGKFEVRFYHLVFQEEIGRVKGHFGPINTLAFHPDGKSFASGGEDGFVRVHFFDDDYFEFKYPEEEEEE
ncbi:WD40-repeat-containing domain protein [Cladochytrium replicatum]|nr:WD40-repeat-containing domain protein [Cladochytrium replicatum]